MILTFVLAASFPFQLRKIGIEHLFSFQACCFELGMFSASPKRDQLTSFRLRVLLHCKSIILVLNFVISLSYFSIELTLYLDRLI
jgi:hypothetical protein